MESVSLLAAWAVICGIKAELAQERAQRVAMWFWRGLFVLNALIFAAAFIDRMRAA